MGWGVGCSPPPFLAMLLLQPMLMRDNYILIKLIIKQIIHLPSHFQQFDHVQANNILDEDNII